MLIRVIAVKLKAMIRIYAFPKPLCPTAQVIIEATNCGRGYSPRRDLHTRQFFEHCVFVLTRRPTQGGKLARRILQQNGRPIKFR